LIYVWVAGEKIGFSLFQPKVSVSQFFFLDFTFTLYLFCDGQIVLADLLSICGNLFICFLLWLKMCKCKLLFKNLMSNKKKSVRFLATAMRNKKSNFIGTIINRYQKKKGTSSFI